MGVLPTCHIIGAGRAGSAIARAFVHAGYPVACVTSEEVGDAGALAREIGADAFGDRFDSAESPSADIVLIAVPDGNIEAVAREYADAGRVKRDATVALHLSGACDSDILQPLRDAGAAVMAFHPGQTFTDSSGADAFRNICFDMEGDDRACLFGEQLARNLGASLIRLDRDQRVRVHCAMSMASNYTVALMFAAFSVLDDAGIDGDVASTMLAPLVRETVEHVFHDGVYEALTGPVVRGDTGTVARHLESLKNVSPDIETLYRVLGRIALDIAQARGELHEESAARLKTLLS